MNKKEKRGVILYLTYLLTMTILSICLSLWTNLMWLWVSSLLLYIIWQMDRQLARQIEIIKSQDYDIDYLMQLKPFKEAKKANTEARIASANCYRYLTRIGELKAEIEQLRILNKNLAETNYKGRHKGKRK